MDLYDELRTIIDAFDQVGVDYAVCGGIAVAFHGHARFTKDIDILVLPDDLENVFNLAERIGFIFKTSPMSFRRGTPEECTIHRRSKIEGSEQLILDFMPVTPILQDAWNSRIVFQWEDRRIKVVSTDGLSLMKRLSGRDRDLLDLKELGLEDPTGSEDAPGSQDETG